jgi:hypothetical protein
MFALLEEFVLHLCSVKSYFLMKISIFSLFLIFIAFSHDFFAYFSKYLNSRCTTGIESHCVLLSLSACYPLFSFVVQDSLSAFFVFSLKIFLLSLPPGIFYLIHDRAFYSEFKIFRREPPSSVSFMSSFLYFPTLRKPNKTTKSHDTVSLKRTKVELEHLHAELKKNEEEESAFAASARSITKQELFPDKTVKQLNAKLLQLKKRKLMAMQKEDENVETFVENYNELRYDPDFINKVRLIRIYRRPDKETRSLHRTFTIFCKFFFSRFTSVWICINVGLMDPDPLASRAKWRHPKK